MRRPRVLLLTPDFPPSVGGIQLLMERLATGFERVDVEVVTLAADGDCATKVATRIPRPPGLPPVAANALLNAAALGKGLRVRPDVVLSGHIAVAPAASALHALREVPYVQYVHGSEVFARPALARLALGRAARVVAVSRYSEGVSVAHGAERGRVRTIPPGVDPPRRGPSDRHPLRGTIACVARLEERYKGHDVLLRAMPLVRARVPHARLLLVGDGSSREGYERLTRALGASGYVHFLGRVPDSERDRVLDEAEVFAMASRLSPEGAGEGFGIVYLEAAARGIPSVAGAVGGALDAVVDGETGVLVDPQDHVAVAEALIELLENRARAEAMGRAAAERARQFEWRSVARRVEDVLLEVAA